MIRKIFVLLLVIVTIESSAQVLNIEKYRLTSDTFNLFLGNVDFSYALIKQSNRIQNFGAGSKTAYLSKLHSYILIGKLNIQTVDKEEVLSAGYVHYRMNFWRKDFLSLEQFNQLQYDAGRNLKERWVFGSSARFNISDKDNFDLSANAGLMYENEYWTNETSLIQNESIKITSHFTLKAQLHKNIFLYSITFYQAKLTSPLKPRITTDTSLKFNFNNKISFQSSYIATLDTAPIVDIADYIYTIENKLVYTF